jgi:hypothetical protein
MPSAWHADPVVKPAVQLSAVRDFGFRTQIARICNPPPSAGCNGQKPMRCRPLLKQGLKQGAMFHLRRPHRFFRSTVFLAPRIETETVALAP